MTDLQVVANEPQTLGPVRLGLPDGTLVVRTKPAGASLSVGGAYRGRTPLTIDVRPDVAHGTRRHERWPRAGDRAGKRRVGRHAASRRLR